jgi:transglutaminase-like putative cysteine protease
LRSLLPLYIAGLVVTLCGIGAVSVTVDDPSLSSLTVGLTVLGFAISLALRLTRMDPNLALYPAFGLGFFLAARRFITSDNLLEAIGGPAQYWQPDVALASFLCWLIVLRSFTLLTNYALLFCPVPTIALLGLTGSSNLNTEILIYFMVFLFSTIFLVGYEHYLRLQQGAQREPDPIFRAHATTALMLFLAVTFAGCLLTLVGRPVLARISPFAGPILRKAQQLPGFPQALQNQSNFVPVGSGPIDLSESPVMDVYAPEGGLWRTRVLDSWNGRGWTAREVEEQTSTYMSTGRVRVHPPQGIAESDYPPDQYEFLLPKDPDLTQSVPGRQVHQQMIVRTPLTQYLPAAPRPVELRFTFEQIQVQDSGVMTSRAFLQPGATFEVVSEIRDPTPAQLQAAPPVDVNTFEHPAYLDVPNNFDRVVNLARRITRGEPTPFDKARAIQGWLEQNCPYTLHEEAAPSGQDSVDYYLFTTKEGACDLVGSAMALMCRAVGIPARVAVGYSHDVRDEATTAFHVTQADAHLWVELYYPGYGWVTVNPAPTPRQTPSTVAGTLANRVRRMWRSLARGGLSTTLALLLITALVGVGAHSLNDSLRVRMRLRRAEQQMLRSDDAALVIPLLYRRMCELLARHGWPRPPTATPHEYLAQLRDAPTAPPIQAQEAAATVTDRFTAICYGAQPLAPSDVEDTRQRLNELVAALEEKAAGRKQ